jgi:cyclophilin family peptidyl-prolyl cis-trans isomerase
VTDQLGVAKGIESLGRLGQSVRPPSADALAVARALAIPGVGQASSGARVRRLALEALIRADALDDELVGRAAADPDPQVRRLAIRGLTTSRLGEQPIFAALRDESPMVRIEALRSLGVRRSEALCQSAMKAAGDPDVPVVLVALDQLGACRSDEAASFLEGMVSDLSTAGSPRGWHRAAHALVALSGVSSERATVALPQFLQSTIWQLRMYAARAATLLKNRSALETLAKDDSDNVRESAIDGLRQIAGHLDDAVYITELTRPGYQVIRAAAAALVDTPAPDAALAPLKAALARLIAEGHDNSTAAREAVVDALTTLGAPPAAKSASTKSTAAKLLNSDLSAENLRRLASPRARLLVRNVGTIEFALITTEAPATVIRFARLAESGYYNGLTFHRVEPNFVVQGGSPGANEFIGDATFMRDEVGLWPHVRGAVGVSTRGADSGDAQFFIDLVDTPRFDHRYTVFAQVLNGIELVDQILEGDVIERVEILTN